MTHHDDHRQSSLSFDEPADDTLTAQQPPSSQPTTINTEEPHKSHKVDPVLFFSGWAYGIRPELWQVFGIELREYIDKDRTAAVRADAIAKGMDKKDAAKKLRIRYLAHAIPARPVAEFNEGDIFHAARHDAPSLQVMSARDKIEVHALHENARHAYRVTASALTDWLRTGHAPPPSTRIDQWDTAHPVLHSAIQTWPPDQT